MRRVCAFRAIIVIITLCACAGVKLVIGSIVVVIVVVVVDTKIAKSGDLGA